jgi:glycerol-3-phosphate acyltransferase PlsY
MTMKILFLVGSYLVGSIPTGYIVVRLRARKDIRQLGSHSTGATNVFRLTGLLFALPVIVVDVLKGFLAPYLAMHFFGDLRIALAAGVLAVLGHCFPVYIGFRGGKGVATTMGVFLYLCFPGTLLSAAVFVLVIALTRYVSLGSLLAAFSYPIWTLVFNRVTGIFYGSAFLALIIVFRHAGNIERLITGRERKLGRKDEATEL